jgi:protein-disulfide isomerase
MAAVAGGLAIAVLLLVAFALTLTRSARAQVDLTIDPAMTRGPASAPVTIVEFSDYQ